LSIKQKPEKLKCMDCQLEKNKRIDFYNANNKMYSNVGKIPICKKCLRSMIDYENIETIYSVFQQLDIKFDLDYWKKAEESKNETFGKYMTMVNSLHQFEGASWKDSVFEESLPDLKMNKYDSEEYGYSETLKEKYGFGYPNDEYLLFEKKYKQLEPSFQLVTTMHEEYFKEYCINRVKETLSKAKGNFKEAKEWAAMVKDVAEAGKLKPSQMSKADLSAGLDGFGQLARAVEEKREIIALLPKFIEQPKDKVDIVLWLYVNYIRDLKGLPEAEYKQIWEFYEKRREDYESQELDSVPFMKVSEENGQL